MLLGEKFYAQLTKSVQALEALEHELAERRDELRREQREGDGGGAGGLVKQRCVVPFAALLFNPRCVRHFCELVSVSNSVAGGKVRITPVPGLAVIKDAHMREVDAGVVATVTFLLRAA